MIVPEWDYCPKDGRLSHRRRFTMKCNACSYEWTKEDEDHKLVSVDNICPKCHGESVLTKKIEVIETLIVGYHSTENVNGIAQKRHIEQC